MQEGARRAATKTQLALTCKPFGGGVGLEAVLVDVVVYKTLADESASKILLVFTEDMCADTSQRERSESELDRYITLKHDIGTLIIKHIIVN